MKGFAGPNTRSIDSWRYSYNSIGISPSSMTSLMVKTMLLPRTSAVKVTPVSMRHQTKKSFMLIPKSAHPKARSLFSLRSNEDWKTLHPHATRPRCAGPTLSQDRRDRHASATPAVLEGTSSNDSITKKKNGWYHQIPLVVYKIDDLVGHIHKC